MREYVHNTFEKELVYMKVRSSWNCSLYTSITKMRNFICQSTQQELLNNHTQINYFCIKDSGENTKCYSKLSSNIWGLYSYIQINHKCPDYETQILWSRMFMPLWIFFVLFSLYHLYMWPWTKNPAKRVIWKLSK